MKLSTRGRYGITLMVDLAINSGEQPVSLKSIAERQNLSEHYLEQLIAPLRNAGLVKSVRGAYGGYVLAKPASEITAGDIIRVLEGPITVVDEEPTGLRRLWDEVRDAINGVLDRTTLTDLAEMMRQGTDDGLMYYI
ncbi:MAG: Rrf2 family transcriptional regulator [Alicyclobacillaceae bacterium]|nr:Rrf2 family transcriptional regulator [Alicyclobacillaceae bacterium]